MEASCCYPGSAGELIQGSLRGKDILLSCPVNLYTKVIVYESKLPQYKYKNNKTAAFLLNVLKRWGYESYEKQLDIEISSKIPKGKGFASSTADLCALYHALLKLFNRKFHQQELIEECIAIEPTDSIIFKEMTLFDYKKGKFSEAIGSYLDFYILVFEGAAVVDTIEFNKKALSPLADIEDLIPYLTCGIRENDIKKIGLAATESIIRNQHRLKYDSLSQILELCRNIGGDGVIGAHSGNCLGIIFKDEELAKYTLRTYTLKDKYKTYIVKSIKV